MDFLICLGFFFSKSIHADYKCKYILVWLICASRNFSPLIDTQKVFELCLLLLVTVSVRICCLGQLEEVVKAGQSVMLFKQWWLMCSTMFLYLWWGQDSERLFLTGSGNSFEKGREDFDSFAEICVGQIKARGETGMSKQYSFPLQQCWHYWSGKGVHCTLWFGALRVCLQGNNFPGQFSCSTSWF